MYEHDTVAIIHNGAESSVKSRTRFSDAVAKEPESGLAACKLEVTGCLASQAEEDARAGPSGASCSSQQAAPQHDRPEV